MKLTEIHVDGFGVWRDLRLRELSPGVTVFYGPNEAGKTTLMHFLRAMLYGVTPERRERYLPPRNGGRPGGALGLFSDEGAFEAERYADRGDNDLGRVTVTLPDGEEQGDRLLRDALESVDERTFSNVFAIGLDEINELGALEGAEAAKWIYRLTSGLDRVSLYDLIVGLRKSRRELLGAEGEASRLTELLAKREQLTAQISDLGVLHRRWAKLAIDDEESGAEAGRLEIELKEADQRARRIESALGLKPLWSERDHVANDRRRFDGLPQLPNRALEHLDELNTKAEEHQRQADVLRGQRRELHQEIEELGINNPLMRAAHRLGALAEQQEWIAALQREGAELTEEGEKLEARIESESTRLAKLWRHKPEPDAAPSLDEEALGVLRPAADAVHEADRLVTEARRDVESRRGKENEYRAQLESALASSDKLGLPTDIEAAGDLVALLRRRLKAEQKIEQARRQARDLDLQSRDLIENQVMPIEWFGWLLTAFIVAAGYALSPLATGSEFGPTHLLAVGSAALLAYARYKYEDNKQDELEECEHQMELAERQITEAREEQETLDADLPLKEGSVSIRLQHAERHLAELEKMLPVEAERRKADKQAESAESFLQSAQEELDAAMTEWRAALRSVGLPDETTPSELEKLAVQHRALDELRGRLDNLQEELLRCDREHARVVKRIEAIAEEADEVLEEGESLEQLDHLLTEQRLQQNKVDHRKKLRTRMRELAEKQRKHAKAAQRIDEELNTLFRAVKVENEEGYRRLAADLDEAARLDDKRERLTREIVAVIGKAGTEDDFAPLMAPERVGKLDSQWEEASAEKEAIEKRLREIVALQTSITEQRAELSGDTSLADKRLELSMVEAQIEEAKERWRERAAVGSMLELIRNDYEEHRQPETLLEASKHLERLTQGRYPRVWTPLADDVLLVDTQDGESLRVENLSRGTREQLYLSVRMAMVAMYGRRGVQLPMVLDDVLVNFDDGRARIAAEVLADFAAEGHQLLVFTCHEHVWRMFRELHADVRRLPTRDGQQLIESEWDEAPEEEVVDEAPVDEVADEPAEEIVEVVVEEVADEPEEEEPFVEPMYVEAEYLDILPPEPERRTRIIEVEYEEEEEAHLSNGNGHHLADPTYYENGSMTSVLNAPRVRSLLGDDL